MYNNIVIQDLNNIKKLLDTFEHQNKEEIQSLINNILSRKF